MKMVETIIFLASVLILSTALSHDRHLIKTLVEAQRFAAENARAIADFSISGIALHDLNPPGKIPSASLSVQTKEGNIRLFVRNFDTSIHRGDLVETTGTLEVNAFHQMDFAVDRIDIRGHQAPPPPRRIEGCDISRPENINHLVSIRGVVSAISRDELDVRYNWFDLRTPTGIIRISVRENDLSITDLEPFIDADVDVTGLVSSYSGWRSDLGYFLSLSKDGIVQIGPSAKRCLDVPAFTSCDVLHRQRTEGVVLAVDTDCFYIRSPLQDCLRVEPGRNIPMPRPGQHVSVAGFVEMGTYSHQFANALVEESLPGSIQVPAPASVHLHDLFTNELGDKAANNTYNGCLVRLSGIIRLVSATSTGESFVTLGSANNNIILNTTSLPRSAISDLIPGATIEITGLCIPHFSAPKSQMGFPRFDHFTILPRDANDIHFIRSPPWWTPLRLLVVIAILVLIIGIIIIWNRGLQLLVRRRSSELFKTQIANARANLRIDERTRLAAELHDSLSQNLSGVGFHISASKNKHEHDPKGAFAHLETAERMLKSSRTELRRCLWDLREETLEEPDFALALAKTVNPVSGDAAVSIRFNIPRTTLTDSTAHTILRSIRELVSNAIVHGHASHIRIAGECHDSTLSFSVSDDGIGFDTSDYPSIPEGHFGLGGIQERITRLGGSFQLNSTRGKGTRAVVTLALPQAHK